jgi:ketosteroid isomerase-like protein
MKKLLLMLLTVALTFEPVVAAEDPAHEELRVVRSEIINAIIKGDIDSVIKHVHPDVVVTWQDSQVCRGQRELRQFFDRVGKDSFKGYKVPPTPDELTILHGGDTGISFGETVANYKLLGRDYEIKSRWTATLVKEGGSWRLAGYHVSMNALDNPLLNAAKKSLFIASGLAVAIGLLLGWLLGRRKKA